MVQLIGYLDYGKKTLADKIKPNSASWGIWAFAAILESVSYIFLTKDWVKNILPVACTISAVVFFLIVLKKGKLSKPSHFELFIVVVDIVILLIWFFTLSPAIANILFVISAVISFIPMMYHTYLNPNNENALPWIIWTLAYFLMSISVVMRWEKWEDFIYPAVFVLLHAVIAYLALDIRSKKSI